MSSRPITEEDLQGYVDRLLDAERQAEVARYLDGHADVARRVRNYRRYDEALRQALGPFAEEPVPAALNLAHMIEQRRRPVAAWWQAVAAAVLLCIGGAGGWALHDHMQAAQGSVTGGSKAGGMVALVQEAADSYDVYAPDHVHPVEFKAAERAEMMQWMSQRLSHPVAVPDLAASGYRFMGGRLLATSQGPAVLLMYDDDQGKRLVMVTRAMAADQHMPMSQHERNAVVGFAWADKGMGYSLVGPLPPEVLHPIANEVRRQIDRDA
jgi:anti-sigma factor RsiW